MKNPTSNSPSSLKFWSQEPFRIFFPLGTLAGIVGVALWPLYFAKWMELYPNLSHARIMAYGLFGGFIFGFLGTAMPRMLTAKPLRGWEVVPLALMHVGMVVAFVLGKIRFGDALFLALVSGFFAVMLPRIKHRQDLPPPGFILVIMSLLCAATGVILALTEPNVEEPDVVRISLQRLLSSQGFILLPILGIGPFLLPRFLGLQSTHDLPESRMPSRLWLKKAAIAFATGGLLIGTFFLEAKSWYHTAYALRFAVVVSYLALEMPFRRAPAFKNALGLAIRIAFVGIAAGFLAVAFFPQYRIGLLHLTLIGGFAVITFAVATRVVFGHSGNLVRLQAKNRWLLVAVGLMLFGMATRISGDYWPKILASHYVYGALIWIIGVLLWAVYVLPKVFVADTEK